MSTAPVMFCHDSTTIYYPQAPGRVYAIGIAALADCNGSDEDLADSTRVTDIGEVVESRSVASHYQVPQDWPCDNEIESAVDRYNESIDSFRDAREQWADWCDRDGERLDTLDGPVVAASVAA